VRTDFFSARLLDEWNANPSKTKNGEEVKETVQGPQANRDGRSGEDPDDRYLEVRAAALQNTVGRTGPPKT
jgi:hypothetical protein